MSFLSSNSAIFLRYFLIGLVVLFVTACLPIPHFERAAPALEGTVKQDGVAAKNIEIVLAVNQKFLPNCRDGKQQTRTDADGRFRFDETQYFTPAVIFGDRLDSWSLCFKLSDSIEAIWSTWDWWGGPPLQRLECVVNKRGKSASRIDLESLKSIDHKIKNYCLVNDPRYP